MANGSKQRFIELLEQDVAHALSAAEAWKELERSGARLEDLQGKPIATAAEMVAKYTDKEKELRALMASITAL